VILALGRAKYGDLHLAVGVKRYVYLLGFGRMDIMRVGREREKNVMALKAFCRIKTRTK
jgi:hypothetical protein